ncbi:MAG: DUF6273 domain-containing protein [Acutalibacteraceae bacterium]
MKNAMKKILCAVLVVVILVISMPFMGIRYSVKAVEYKNGDIIKYGTYPKSKVTNSSLITQLNSVDKTWKNYGRYTKNGTYVNWYKYADFFYKDIKYRAINLINYYSGYEAENGYSKNTIYYFQYSPLSWKILDSSTGLIICNEIIDCRAYQDIVINVDEEYWQDTSKSFYASDYSKSFIREWMNKDLYNTAFTADQKSNIKITEIDNKDSKYLSNVVSDKMFLISYDDANTMLNSSSRDRYGTDYSKCLGLHRMPGNFYGWGVGQSWWWLRTPYNSNETRTVYDDGAGGGSPIRSYYVDNTSIGVVPACCLDELKNDISINNSGVFPDGYNFEEDSYNFGNYADKISEKYFITFYEEASGKVLYDEEKERNKHGVCFGMAYTTAAFNRGFPTIDKVYDLGNSVVAERISDIYRDFEFQIGESTIKVDDYIKYAYIYQKSAELSVISSLSLKETLEHYIENDMIGIVLLISRYQIDDNGEYVLDENGKKISEGGHAVLAVGMEEKGDKTIIYVDDSNNEDELQTITFDENGNWEFSNPWTDSVGSKIVNSQNSVLEYTVDVHVPYRILSTGKKTVSRDEDSNSETYIEGMDRVDADKVLLSISADNYTISSEDCYEIRNDFSGNSIAENKTDLYWISNDKTVTISDLIEENSEISLAGDNTIITAAVTKDTVATMTIDETDVGAELETEKGKEYTLSFETIIIDEECNTVETIIAVNGVASGEEITANQTETGLVVKGVKDGVLTLTKDDEVIATHTITDAESDVKIIYDKNGETDEFFVDYDTHSHILNGDGVCEKCGVDVTEDCSCKCHKSGFLGIIWKIFRFFYKLFGTNKTCDCGVSHY